MNAPALLPKNFFRREYANLVALLSRRIGVHHIETIEDAVQSALMTALEQWGDSGAPGNPSAWLYRVAHRRVLDELRGAARRRAIISEQGDRVEASEDPLEVSFEQELPDDLLRMLFVCCDPQIPAASQLVFSLKILCGFDVQEIALRLFLSEANVYKKLSRARQRLHAIGKEGWDVAGDQQNDRLPTVHHVLYLLFTEGYLSSHAEQAIRRELCAEAIRLATLLTAHRVGQESTSRALRALMHLHMARLGSRQDETGALLLLEEQERSLWDQSEIQEGLKWLAASAEGETFSRYHAEAAIAAEHCLAPSFKDTRWHRVAELYELLEHVSPSPLHRLNRAIATAEWKGAQAGLAVLEGVEPPTWLAGSYLWSAAQSDLLRRAGEKEKARERALTAMKTAPNDAIRQLLKKRLMPPFD